MEIETVKPIGARGSIVLISETNSQSLNGTTALYLGLDDDPKVSLTIHFPKPVLAWGVDYLALGSVGDSVQVTFNDDTYDFPGTNSQGFIGFVSDTALCAVMRYNNNNEQTNFLNV
ncbi:MAG: hypothetical protein F6K47_35575 [Symploca sp. SIO2E6]|nr:hypothetical protein [Symploca sp. SIO2E6]